MTFTIQGSGQNSIQRGADTGRQVAHLAKNNPSRLGNANIQYTTIDNSTGKFSIDGGLAYAMESLKAFDLNGDGTVSTQETGGFGQLIDLNNDGKVSAAENLAYTMYQDAAGNMDGIATVQERNAADQALINDPGKARSQMQELLQGHNLESKEQQLKQNMAMQNNPMMQMMQMLEQMMQQMAQAQQQQQCPPPPPPPPPQQQPQQQMMQMFMQMFMQMMQQMMQMFGMNQQTQ